MNQPVSSKRSRSRVRRGTFWFVLFFLVVFLAWTLSAIFSFDRGLGPQRDFLAELNRKNEEVPPEQLVWPELRQLVGGFDCPPDRSFRDHLAESLHALAPTEQDRWLGERQELLESIRVLLHRPRLGVSCLPGLPEPLDHALLLTTNERAALALTSTDTTLIQQPASSGSEPLIALPLRFLSPLRTLAQLLEADLASALRDNAHPRAVEDCIALLNLARLCRQNPMLMAQLSAAALEAMADQGILTFLSTAKGVDPELLAYLSQALAAGFAPFSFEGERMQLEDLVQRIYSDDGAGDGVLILSQMGIAFTPTSNLMSVSPQPPTSSQLTDFFLQPLIRGFCASRREVLDTQDALLAEAQALMDSDAWALDWTSLDAQQSNLASRGPLRSLHLFPLPLLLSDLEPIVLVQLTRQFLREVTRTVVALHQFRARYGVWPERLQELQPEWLSQLPRDPYDGLLLRYQVRDGRPLLWSIGPDGVDQGGQFVKTGTPFQLERVDPTASDEADFLLWPPSALNHESS